jgi:hypothetical protein
MIVLIVSIDHKLQLTEDSSDSVNRRKLKLALRAILEAHLEKHEVSAICEESLPKEMTIARQLANRGNPQIPWKCILMDEDERKAEGIFETLKNRPSRPDPNNPAEEIEKRIPEDDVREDFFIREILQANNASGEVLVLLGDMHVIPVAEKLRAVGHTVTTRHELVPVRRWEL